MMNSKEMETAIELEKAFVKSLTPEQKAIYLEVAIETGSLLHAKKACKKVVVPVTGTPLIGSGSYLMQDGEFSVFRGKDNSLVIFCHGLKNGGLSVMQSVMDGIIKEAQFKKDCESLGADAAAAMYGITLEQLAEARQYIAAADDVVDYDDVDYDDVDYDDIDYDDIDDDYDDKPVEVTGKELEVFTSYFAELFHATAVTIVCCYGGMNKDFVIDGVPVTFAVHNERAAIIDCCDYIENEVVAWEGDDLTEIYFSVLPLLM